MCPKQKILTFPLKLHIYMYMNVIHGEREVGTSTSSTMENILSQL